MESPGSDGGLEAGSDAPLREEEEALGDEAPSEEIAGPGGTGGGRGRFAGLPNPKVMLQQRLYLCSGVPLPIPLNVWLISHVGFFTWKQQDKKMDFHSISRVSRGHERRS